MLDRLPAMPELPVAPHVLPATLPSLEHLSALCALQASTVLPAVHRLALHVVLGYIPLPVRPLATTVVRVSMPAVAELARIVWLALIPIVQDNRPVLHVQQDFTHPPRVRRAHRAVCYAWKVITASLARQHVEPAHPDRPQHPAPPFASL